MKTASVSPASKHRENDGCVGGGVVSGVRTRGPAAWLSLLVVAVQLQCARSEEVSWRSDSGNTRLTFDTSNNHLTLLCKEGAGYSCAELEEARAKLRVAARRKEVEGAWLKVQGCALREPLACVPGASTVAVLMLEDTRGLATDCLRNLTTVTNIEIEADKNLTSMPYAALSQLPNLTSFTLWGGVLNSLAPDEEAGAGAGQLLQLRVLEVSGCNLNALPAAALSRVSGVTVLSLWDNGIENITEDALRGVSNLKFLNLNNNKLSSLPARLFERCAALTELHLGENRLGTLGDAAISSAKSLEKVVLNGNLLEVLPLFELSGLRRLVSLDLSYNRLRGVLGAYRDNFTQPLPLIRLDLSHNNLTALSHSSLEGLQRLQHLDLSYNRLTELDADTFFAVRNHLINLTVSHNTLRVRCGPSMSPLRELLALRRALLGHNSVSAVCADWRALPHLTYFDLSHNTIVRLTPEDLEWMSPATVDLTYNSITSVRPPDQNASYWRTTPTTFILKGNPFACDCELYSFVQAYGRNTTVGNARLQDDDYKALTCASPPSLADTALTAARRLPCVACTARCACSMDAAAGVYDLRCPAPPTRRDYPHTDVPIRLTLATATSFVSNLPPTVKYLDLRNLSLMRAPRIDAPGVEVDLRDNRLTSVPQELLGAGRALRLAGNPLRCACGEATPEGLRGHEERILDLPRVTCAADDGGRCGASDPLVLATSLTVCALVVGVGAFLSCKRSIRVRIKEAVTGRRREVLRYDVFLSFAEEDAGWVWSAAVPALERGGLRVCVPARDWRPGALVAEEGARSVCEARRTVAVLSPAAVRCGWRRRELAAALRLRRAVALLRDDAGAPPIAPPRGLRAVVHASDPEVWDKLRKAVCR